MTPETKFEELAKKKADKDSEHHNGSKLSYRDGFVIGALWAKAQCDEELRIAREALKFCRGAMTYAYEDHCDQYYLNVRDKIDEALAGKKET